MGLLDRILCLKFHFYAMPKWTFRVPMLHRNSGAVVQGAEPPEVEVKMAEASKGKGVNSFETGSGFESGDTWEWDCVDPIC
jgi:hypothetical protein